MTIMDKIRDTFGPGDTLNTPSGRATFKISEISPEGIRVIVGEGEWPIFVPKACWEGIPDYLQEKGPVLLASMHGKSVPDTFDDYIQGFTNGVSAVSYVAPILEKIGIAEIDRERPARIRLI